ncbi:hypothetical protein ES707_14627 [subsurface metagenome]
MDLKEVIAKAKNIAESAHSSFHAGRLDDAENYLMVEMQTIARYFDAKTKTADDVTESPTSETSQEKTKETPAQVPGSKDSPALPASQFLAANVGQVVQGEKPA